MGLVEGKVAIVTGSGRGAGKGIATMLAKEGASVIINDLDAEPAEETASEINATGAKAAAFPGSVTDKEFPDKLIKKAIDEFGKLDIIVNNAGFGWDTVIQKMTDEMWYAVMDIHTAAPFRILRAAAPYFKDMAKKDKADGKRVYRKVVNISSIGGLYGNAGQANYSAAKAGQIGLSKAMAKEWGRYNVNVNVVAYGFIQTRMTGTIEEGQSFKVGDKEVALGIPSANLAAISKMIPLGRPGTPEDAAGPVVFLASHLADYITGEVISCSGGLVI